MLPASTEDILEACTDQLSRPQVNWYIRQVSSPPRLKMNIFCCIDFHRSFPPERLQQHEEFFLLIFAFLNFSDNSGSCVPENGAHHLLMMGSSPFYPGVQTIFTQTQRFTWVIFFSTTHPKQMFREILLSILALLDVPSMVAISRCSTGFRDLTKDPLLFATVDLRQVLEQYCS